MTIEEKVAEWSNLYPTLPVSANHFTFWHQHNRSFDAIAVMRQDFLPLGAGGRPLQVGVLSATPDIFSVLQVQTKFGRPFTASEAQRGHDHVVILTYDLWREQFRGDPGILDKTISLNGFPYSVIGVLPQSFRMPSVLALAGFGSANRPLAIEALVPLAFSKDQLAEEMGDLNYFGLARLKAGTSVAMANADLNALQHTIGANLPADAKATLSAAVTPFQENLVGNNPKPLMILLAAVLGLLLVGCVNITNLLLSRAVGQKRQMAVAAALGAGRAEMVRMAIRETALLAVVGGGMGVLLAAAIVPGMQQYLPPALDFRGPLHLDWAGVGCALLLAVLATLAAGAAPAFMVSRTAPNEVLHSDSRLSSESRGSRRARRVLVGVEAGVSIALVLIGAAHFFRVADPRAVESTRHRPRLPHRQHADPAHRPAFSPVRKDHHPATVLRQGADRHTPPARCDRSGLHHCPSHDLGRRHLAGVAPGLILAYMAARLLQSLLAGVNPADVLTFSSAVALCLLTALLGTLIPALRAVRADPAAVMRAE